MLLDSVQFSVRGVECDNRGVHFYFTCPQKGMSAEEQMFWKAGRDGQPEGLGEGDNGAGR